MRVAFNQVFQVQGGMISPVLPVEINGITMGPGVGFGAGVSFGGVDLGAIAGRDLEVVRSGAGYRITGHY